MAVEVKPSGSFKQKAKHEVVDFLVIALYLSFFFCSLVTYTMVTLRTHGITYFNYAFALINALIIAKIILLGELAHVGDRLDGRPLYQCVLYKAFVFDLLVFTFHFVEEFVKRLIHGAPFGTVWHNIDYPEMLSRMIVIFCAFLPLFAFRELRRVLGEERFNAILRNPRRLVEP